SWKDAGVVDEDVHIRGALGEPTHIVGRLEISAHELRLAPACRDGGDDLCTTRLAPAANQDTRAFTRERFRRRPTDAGGATGHQRSLPAQFVHCFLLKLVSFAHVGFPYWTIRSTLSDSHWTVKS